MVLNYYVVRLRGQAVEKQPFFRIRHALLSKTGCAHILKKQHFFRCKPARAIFQKTLLPIQNGCAVFQKHFFRCKPARAIFQKHFFRCNPARGHISKSHARPFRGNRRKRTAFLEGGRALPPISPRLCEIPPGGALFYDIMLPILRPALRISFFSGRGPNRQKSAPSPHPPPHGRGRTDGTDKGTLPCKICCSPSTSSPR